MLRKCTTEHLKGHLENGGGEVVNEVTKDANEVAKIHFKNCIRPIFEEENNQCAKICDRELGIS